MELVNGAPATADFNDGKVGNMTELVDESRWERFQTFAFADIKCVLPHTSLIAGPEMELVPGPVAGEAINHRISGEGSLGFRQVETEEAADAIVLADDEDRLSLGKQRIASLGDAVGGGFPAADATEGIPFRWKCRAGEAPDAVRVVQQKDQAEPEGAAGGKPGFDKACAQPEAIRPIENGRAHAEEVEGQGPLVGPFPESGDGHEQAGEEDRIQQTNLSAEEFAEEPQGGLPSSVEPPGVRRHG